jgi:hypothetical protein
MMDCGEAAAGAAQRRTARRVASTMHWLVCPWLAHAARTDPRRRPILRCLVLMRPGVYRPGSSHELVEAHPSTSLTRSSLARAIPYGHTPIT